MQPENILLCRKDSTDIKVIDFGSACYDSQKVHTYIQSRFYRSPEVILGAGYGVPIDMWSVGCIIVELVTGQPLFPGHDEKEQLLYQVELLGLPTPELLARSKRTALFFDANGELRQQTDHKGRRRTPATRTLARVLGRPEPELEDFVLQCLRWDPDERITPRDALRHPFVAGLTDAAPRMRRSTSDAAAAADEDDEDVEAGVAQMSLTAPTVPSQAAPVSKPSYVLPPVSMTAAMQSSVVTAAPIPPQPVRRPSSSRMTTDQLAHTERMRGAVMGSVRRASVSREKAAAV